MRRDIREGELVGPLPDEVDLMKTFGVSRNTVRLALGLLADEGLVTRLRGVGTFAAAFGAVHPVGSTLGLIDSQGASRIRHELLVCETIPTPTRVGAMLHDSTIDQVVLIERLTHVDGIASAMRTSYLPVDIGTPLFDADLTLDFYVLLEDVLGIKLAGAAGISSAIPADAATARLLGLRPGAPIVLRESTLRSVDGRIVDVSFIRARSDRIVQGYESYRAAR